MILNNVEDIINISTIYSTTIIKDIKNNSKFVLGIYQKIDQLNIIEKYIFSNRLQRVKGKNIKDEIAQNDILKHYMKEFIL